MVFKNIVSMSQSARYNVMQNKPTIGFPQYKNAAILDMSLEMEVLYAPNKAKMSYCLRSANRFNLQALWLG